MLFILPAFSFSPRQTSLNSIVSDLLLLLSLEWCFVALKMEPTALSLLGKHSHSGATASFFFFFSCLFHRLFYFVFSVDVPSILHLTMFLFCALQQFCFSRGDRLVAEIQRNTSRSSHRAIPLNPASRGSWGL